MTVERVAIALPRLPSALEGFTILAIADVHASASNAPRRVAVLVEAAASLRPDVILLLGDIFHRARHVPPWLPLLSDLRAPLGVWACLGNHEHGFDWRSRYLGPAPVPSPEEWRARLAEVGVRLLVNEAARLDKDDAHLWLVGVDDAYSGHDDLDAALARVTDGAPRVAATHSPDLLDHARARELDLILAGHTHGGQIRLPLLGALWAPCHRFRQRAAGLVRDNGATAYVSRGAGEGLPLRIGCPREIALLELRPAGAAQPQEVYDSKSPDFDARPA